MYHRSALETRKKHTGVFSGVPLRMQSQAATTTQSVGREQSPLARRGEARLCPGPTPPHPLALHPSPLQPLTPEPPPLCQVTFPSTLKGACFMVTEESVPGQPPWQLVFPPWWGYSNYGRGISLTGGGVGWQSINTQRALPPPPPSSRA